MRFWKKHFPSCSLYILEIVCVFDQALFAKAAEIVWKQKKFKALIIWMGTFHTICNLLSIIGKRFQDAVLGDLCVEAGILAEGSVVGVMQCRKYNRAVRLHELVYESLLRLVWRGFLTWMNQNQAGELHNLQEAQRCIESFKSEVCQETFEKVLQTESCTHP